MDVIHLQLVSNKMSKRIVPYSDSSESDDDDDDDDDDDFPPKRRKHRKLAILDSDDEDYELDLIKKKPVKMIEENNEEDTSDIKHLFHLQHSLNKKSRKFKTESHVMTATFKKFEELPPRELIKLFDNITEEIKSTLKTEPTDKIRITINHPSLNMGIYIPFMNASQLEGVIMLNEIEKVLQSNTEFSLTDGRMTFIITHAHPSSGDGKKKKLNSTEILDSKIFAKNMQSIIQINNDNDSMCFARALAVGICHVNHHDTDDWRLKWNQIRRSDRQLQKSDAEDILMKTGISPNQSCGLDEYRIIQTFLYAEDYVIKVHNQHTSVEFVFEHPVVYRQSKVLHLYYHQGHYDYISSITGFFGCSYYCEFCDVAYQNRESHSCLHNCKACFTIGKCMSFETSKQCKDCNRFFYGSECFHNHKIVVGKQKKSICQLVKSCLKCGGQYKVRKALHVCKGMKKCRYCQKITILSHRCHIQPYKRKLNKTDDKASTTGKKKPLFIFYDFECKQDTGVHIPNYCIAHYACDECINESLDFHCSTCNTSFSKEREVVFQGVNTLTDFCNWLFSDQHKGITAIAHNFKGYDGQFILHQVISLGVKLPKLIMNGNSIMKLELNGVRLIDSFNFMSCALAKFPDTFGLHEMKKGYFPHWANTDQFCSYVGPYLDVKYYKPDSMSKEGREKFMVWYNEKVEQSVIFDFQKEIESYCRSDVDILRRGCGQFRKVFMKHGGIDPLLESVTIADACNKVWRQNYLPKGKIAIISSKDPSQRRFSMKAIRWIQSIANEKSIYIQHARNDGEFRIGRYSVDGYHEKTNTVYEFLGDLYHGCPVCYPKRNQLSPITGETMQHLYNSTMNRLEEIKVKGFNVEIMWEHEFDAKIKNDKVFKSKIDKLFPYCDPIDPREALYGGRCNSVKITHDINESKDKEIKYIDICSLYPFVCKHKSYPVGHPKVITAESIDMENIRQYEGLIKCKVSPPDDLLHPVLPVHCNNKLMFPLCMKCAQESSNTCNHNQDERSMVGTWITFELFKALDMGYQLIHVYEIWHFTSISNQFFQGYVDNFLKIKQEASGYPGWCKSDSEKQKFIHDYEKAEGVKLDSSSIQKNPGLRSFAKIMLNCLWGKLAQREIMSQTEYIKDATKYFEMMNNSNVLVKHVEIFDNECDFILVNYETKLDHIETHATANVIVGSYVTAYARMELYSILEKLKSRVLYFDTDSCMYIHDPCLWNPPIINSRLGKWTDEEPDCTIVKFRGLGPKNYAYEMKTKEGKRETKCKVKGITLDYNTCQLINFETFTQCAEDRNTEIKVTYACRIKRHTDRSVTSEAQTKTYRSVYTKRVIVNDTDTVPYGYKSLRQ